MAKKLNSQKVLLEHSKAKVQLLGNYLDKFLNIISNLSYIQRIKIYDLFCGEGVYERGGEGSPITILKCLQSLHQVNPANNENIPPIDLRFNDLNPNKIQKLKGIISSNNLHNSNFGKLTFTNNDYKTIVNELATSLKKKRNEKAFIFIDPYGYKEIKAQEIKDLLSAKNSEVLLFLPTQFMYRFDKNGTPQSLIDFLSEIVDYKSWKPNFSVWEFIGQLKDGFRGFMGTNFFIDTFTIKKTLKQYFVYFSFLAIFEDLKKC